MSILPELIRGVNLPAKTEPLLNALEKRNIQSLKNQSDLNWTHFIIEKINLP